MSAASVAAPLTTTHIQSPYRFSSVKDARRAQQQALAQGSPQEWQRTRPLEQTQQQQHSRQQSPQAATQHGATSATQRHSPSPAAARVNPNSRTSAGFPLAATAAQKADIAQRRLEERLDWEDQHEAHVAAVRAAEEAAAAAATATSSRAAARAAQDAQYRKNMRDSKVPYHERGVPSRPEWAEDPLTARATEHTGLYPGPFYAQHAPEGADFVPDTEPSAPEGSPERAEQRRRVNPLLDSLYISKSDAPGLGYGRTHKSYFRYISSNGAVSAEILSSAAAEAAASAAASRSQAALQGFKSKDGRGYRPEVRALGWGAPHGPAHNEYVSVRRADDVLKDYPNREACEKFIPRKGQ